VPLHRQVTTPCTRRGGLQICLQILHAGNLAYSDDPVAPSAIAVADQSAHAAGDDDRGHRVNTIADFVRCAERARAAGYDGVEIIGSAGYLLSTFLLEKTNQRRDEWGGSYENRMRLPLEIVRRTRGRRPDFIIIYRIAAMELMEDGSSWDEVVSLAKAVEAAGATIMSTHFVWHQARVPTISDPRAARRLRASYRAPAPRAVDPLITSNRINMPDGSRAGARRGDGGHHLHGAADARGPGVRPQGLRGTRRRDQHLHRL
jgi:2,4-dienoyl-CoA reductase (NADPH2)